MGSFSKKHEFTMETEVVAFQTEHRTCKLKEGGAPGYVRKESKQGWGVTGHGCRATGSGNLFLLLTF